MSTYRLHDTRLSRRDVIASLALGAGALALGVRPSGRLVSAQGTANPDGTEPIAAGADLMPQVPVCWRLVSYVAKPAGQAPALARTLNFLMPTSASTIRVRNDTTGEESLLVTHVVTAAFGAQNDVQTRYAERAEPAPYVAWELVIAELAEDPATIGDATLIDLTDPFTAPQGTQEMELVALVVPDIGPEKTVPAVYEIYPMLGYVHGHALAVTRPDGTEEFWEAGSTHPVRPGDRLAYAGEERANGFFLFPRFAVQRTYE
ncbi:MAG: hypothetical protein ACRDJW_02295 [Thermomicrobiales bacterium]